MSAAVETMVYVREVPWHGLGTMVREAPTSADALSLACLDWEVIQKPVFLEGSEIPVPNYKANVRSKDEKVLGIVTDRYKVVQNTEAFEFTDSLITGDVHYETAGALLGGRKIWLLAQMPSAKVAGDEVEPYLCFSNTHDGSGAVKVFMTPVRVVCNNTLNFALSTAKRWWSIRHVGDIQQKVGEARESLELANRYMIELDKYADKMANKTVTDEQLKNLLNEIFPVEEDATQRSKDNVQKLKDEFMICYFMPDIAKFRGTAWGVLNAMTDMAAHSQPMRNTQNYKENNWNRIMDGHWLVDKMVAALA